MKFELDHLVQEFAAIELKLQDGDIYGDPKLLKETMLKKKFLENTVYLYNLYKAQIQNLAEAKDILANEKDPEMIELAKMQVLETDVKIPELEEALKLALLPKDKNDEKNIILEVRAGAGGDEAALFAREMANAYELYAREAGFQVEVLEENALDTGGIKEKIFKISGSGAYSQFKFEGGTHRVQRIPQTEAKGRVHTSTVTVAVLPEVEAIDVVIRDEDLDIMVCRSSGAGGQHVNKTNSAIRMVHLPTGIAVECQDERSQLQNKNKALEILRARVWAIEEDKRNAALGSARLAQVGTGDRSEKIRTYNFPQDRVTDHRIGANFPNIPAIMQGKLGHIIEALQIADQSAKLAEAGRE
ncbi:MAG: peptide chain release factor 1 [Candidatus Gracilibacteria bacterium]|nr:peptide chain release factor 1 [Candidatus Gracilibacteria bacterium]